MSFMFELYYGAPYDSIRESRVAALIKEYGGEITFREEPPYEGSPSMAICLTCEFDEREAAEKAASRLYELGEHVEGPRDYGEG